MAETHAEHTPNETHLSPDAQGAVAAWTMSVQSLRSGMRLTEHVYDPSGELLLSAGKRITSSFLADLQQRDISHVLVGCPTPASSSESLRGKYERQLDDLLTRMISGRGGHETGSAAQQGPLSPTELASEAQARMEQHAAASNVAESVARSCSDGGTRLPRRVQQTIEDFAKAASIDKDLLPLIVSMQEPKNEYLFDHCVNVSLLSMTVGAHLGLDESQIIELGTGTLLLDVGMLRVPDSIRFAPRTLTADERIEVQRHTLYTLDSLQRLDGLSAVAPFVGYQVHERNDGTGYPRGRSGMFIHLYAKIAAVMDVYSAMTRPRPHRPAFLPYQAMKQILMDGSRGKLDRTVIRALLDCMSLFPVGSLVELDAGVRARVVRTNRGDHTRPIVMEVDSAGNTTGTTIDLKLETSTSVRQAIPDEPVGIT